MQRERRTGEKLGRIGTDWQALAISVWLIARIKNWTAETTLDNPARVVAESPSVRLVLSRKTVSAP